MSEAGSQQGTSDAPRKRWVFIGLYALTGLTSVAYEILWVRMLSLQFGISVFAVVITVAAFMAGLGAGSLFAASRAAGRIKRPLVTLALLEGGIACYALLTPWLLKFAGIQIEFLAAHLSGFQWYAILALAAWFLLLVPAFAMGAGFTMILTALGDSTASVAQIYGLNTLGAACGALLPLWLLPTLGLGGSISFVASIGIITSLVMLQQSRNLEISNTLKTKTQKIKPGWAVLLGYGGIGAASLVLEIAWTRLFGMVLLRTEYVLAVILASFLLGIAIGSLIAPRTHKKGWFTVLPITSCGFTIGSLWLLPVISAWIERTTFSSMFAAMSIEGLVLILITLPVTLSLGAWLPLLNSRTNGGSMWLYGANSVGATLGAVVAGLVLIPAIGSAAAIVTAGIALLTIGLVWSEQRLAWLAVPALVLIALPVSKLPPVSALLPQAQAGSKNLYVYEDAVSMTHVVEQRDGQRLLLTDLQRMDASTDPTAVFVQSNQARLPLLLHENPHSVLFLGLGTGISVSGSLPFQNLQRYAVELSQGAINAADKWFEPANHGVMKQTQVIRDDARHFLLATPRKYDVIIGDVFHPDLAGMSALLSIQEFVRARSRLTENGIFVQWLALNQFDRKSLDIVLRTFNKVFPDAQMFLDGMHLALVGPKKRFAGAIALLNNAHGMTTKEIQASTAGEGIWTWLGRYCGPISEGAGPLQDEWLPEIEFSLPRARYSGKIDVSSVLREIIQARPDMQAAEQLLRIPNKDREKFERAYAATELMGRSWLADMAGNSMAANRLMQIAYQANPEDRWVEYALADSMYSSLASAEEIGISKRAALKRILEINPQHVEALRALWELQRNEHDPNASITRAKLLAVSPLDLEARNAQ